MTHAPPKLPTLPLHLMLQTLEWMSLSSAYACWKQGLPHWKKATRPPPAEIQRLLEASGEASHQAKKRLEKLLVGADRYLQTTYQRDVREPPVIWRKGSARVLDYGSLMPRVSCLTPILFIPSLINRYTILDLTQEQSFVRYLAQQGCYPLVLDWGSPGAMEKEYDAAAYVTEVLIPAVEFLHRTMRAPVTLAGYCLGGVLALAAAQLCPKEISRLALFATPWDYAAADAQHTKLAAPGVQQLSRWVEEQEVIAPEWIQSVFSLMDPWLFPNKFSRFADMRERSRAEEEFLALEHWVNDGVPLARGVAQDAMIAWAQHNEAARGKWQVAGEAIIARKVRQPTLVVVPKNDRIVPRGCALALARQLPQATLIEPQAGHVGMVVGSRAKREVWEKFVRWMRH